MQIAGCFAFLVATLLEVLEEHVEGLGLLSVVSHLCEQSNKTHRSSQVRVRTAVVSFARRRSS